MTLSSGARMLLWSGSGAFVGIAVGALFVDADVALAFAPLWALLFATFALSTWFVDRRRQARDADVKRIPVAQRGSANAAAPLPPDALRLTLTFPDVPPSLPAVVGVGETLHVRAFVGADSCAVRLSGQPRDGARFLAGEGVTGTDGAVTFALRAAHTGELLLEAEASLDARRGHGNASVSIVRYEEEIERLFGEFRAYAHGVLGPESKADTARELAEKLRVGADAATSRALLELARVYELVAYGERVADRALYLQLVHALLVLEGGAAQPHGAGATTANATGA